MSKLKEIKDVPIFMYGENSNGYRIDESEVSNFDKFKNVPIINRFLLRLQIINLVVDVADCIYRNLS